MKRYALFAGACYYASGGWADFVDSFDSVEDAQKHSEAFNEEYAHWFQIIDLHTGQEVVPQPDWY